MRRLIASVFGGIVLACSPAEGAIQAVKAIAVGGGYGFAVAADGTVWAWGAAPTQVNGISDVAAISANSQQCFAVKNDGTVWAWDFNGYVPFSPYGVNKFVPTPPVQIKGLSGITAISAGGGHVLALKNDGTVWAWGGNYLGALGNGTTTSRTTPAQVSGLTGVIGIAAGQVHSLAVKSDGTVWAWGDNQWGQLGNGSTTAMGTANSLPVQVSGVSGAVAVAAGYGHSMALKGDGTVWVWGHNGGGQAGDGTKMNVRPTAGRVSGIDRVAAIAATDFGALSVRNDGTLWKWGQLTYGTEDLTPAQVNWLAGVRAVAGGLALKSDGTVWVWQQFGNGAWGDGVPAVRVAPVQITAGLPEVSSVAACSNGGLAVGFGHTVWEWRGASAPSQVNGLSGATAVAGGFSHSLALLYDGTVWEWTADTAPAPVSGVSDVKAIAAGDTGSVAVKRDGTVWTWNTPAKAGPIQVNGLSDVAAVAVAFEFGWWDDEVDAVPALRGLALKQDGTVWTWGGYQWNSADRMPQVTNEPVQVPELSGITAIAGGEISLAVKADGTVWQWDESVMDTWAPVQVEGLTGVKAVAAGARLNWFQPPHALALKSDGTVWAWGQNSNGQLGDGTALDRATPVQVAGIRGVYGISAAGSRSLAVANETVWAWGDAGTYQTRPEPVQVIPPGSPDLTIAMKHSGDFTVGETASYAVTITNVGWSATNGVVRMTDTLPPGLTYLSAGGDGWTCSTDDRVVTCANPGPMIPGSPSVVTLNVRVEAQAFPGVTNLAVVDNYSDPNLINNTIGDPTVVKAGERAN